MTKKIQVHVDGLAAMGERFVDAWHRAQAGEPVDEAHVTFLSFEAMTETLSPRRLELLRHVRQHGAASVRELATALGHCCICCMQAANMFVIEPLFAANKDFPERPVTPSAP